MRALQERPADRESTPGGGGRQSASTAWRDSPRLTTQRTQLSAAFGPPRSPGPLAVERADAVVQPKCAACEAEDDREHGRDRSGANAAARCEGGEIVITYNVPTDDPIGQCIVAHEQVHQKDREECCARHGRFQQSYRFPQTPEYDAWHKSTSADTEVNAYTASAACVTEALQRFDADADPSAPDHDERRRKLSDKLNSELLSLLDYEGQGGKASRIEQFAMSCPYEPDGVAKDPAVTRAAEQHLRSRQADDEAMNREEQERGRVERELALARQARLAEAARLMPKPNARVRIKGGIELEASWDVACKRCTFFDIPGGGLMATVVTVPRWSGNAVVVGARVDRNDLPVDHVTLRDLDAKPTDFDGAAQGNPMVFTELRLDQIG